MRRRPIRRRSQRQAKRPRLELRIAKALDLLNAIPEDELSIADKTVLSRIKNIHTGIKSGKLTETDYVNMKKIAARKGTRLP